MPHICRYSDCFFSLRFTRSVCIFFYSVSYRIRRIMERREMGEKDAKAAIRRHDRSRRMYHDTYSEGRWGDADNYEMILSSSLLGVDRSAQVLYDYLKLRDII